METNTPTLSKALNEFPGPTDKWQLSLALEMQKGILPFIQKYGAQYGNSFQVKVLSHHLLVINEPEFAKHILQDNNKNYIRSFGYEMLSLWLGQGLLTSDGDFWLRQRRLAQPAFHKKRLQVLAETMSREASELSVKWEALDGKRVDISKEMTTVTMQIVAKTLFGTDVTGIVERVGEAIVRLNENIMQRIKQPVKVASWLPVPMNFTFRKYKNDIEGIINTIIEKRRGSNEHRDDLLAMLIEARDEDTGEGMDDRQLVDESMTIFAAGHETSALAMTWIWYLLAQAPEVVEKLEAELDQVLGDRDATAADIPNLVYTRQIIDETLRLYPTAWVIGRRTVAEDEVGGFRIPAGCDILISAYEIHRRPDLWEDPDKFDPDRFAPGKTKGMDKFRYFPFGGGPRMCIGNNFAIMEMVILLATLARRFRVTYLGTEPLGLDPLLTLRPKGEVPVKLEMRK